MVLLKVLKNFHGKEFHNFSLISSKQQRELIVIEKMLNWDLEIFGLPHISASYELCEFEQVT